MSTKVWVVETGCYSDRTVRGIFSTRAKAQQYINRCRESLECYYTDFNEIQGWILDEPLKEREYTRWGVGIMLDTGSLETREYKQQMWGIPHSGFIVWENIPAYNGRGAVRAESCRSAAHALKLAVEGRQQWLREHPLYPHK